MSSFFDGKPLRQSGILATAAANVAVGQGRDYEDLSVPQGFHNTRLNKNQSGFFFCFTSYRPEHINDILTMLQSLYKKKW